MLRISRSFLWLSFGRASLLSVLSPLLVASAALPARAESEAAKHALKELGKSDAIVVGRATVAKQGTVEDTPVLLVTLQVGEKIKGTVAPEIEIVVPRVFIQPGKVLVESGPQDQPVVSVGEEVLLFVTRYPGRESSYSITSGNLGKISVTTSPDDQKRAERYLLTGPVAGGVPLAALIHQIRQELNLPEEKPATAPDKPQ